MRMCVPRLVPTSPSTAVRAAGLSASLGAAGGGWGGPGRATCEEGAGGHAGLDVGEPCRAALPACSGHTQLRGSVECGQRHLDA